MTKLAIFGDSFVDPVWKNKSIYNWTWPNRLAQDYVTENHGLMGTGPDYAFEKLLQYIEEQPTESLQDTCLIFVCSDPHRLNLQDFWQEDKHQVQIFGVADRSIRHPKHMFVRDLFKHYMTTGWSSREDFKILCAVNSVSHLFKRVLYWPAIDPYPIYTNMLQLNSNMTVVQPGLFACSLKGANTSNPLDDKRVNHFDPDQHQDIYLAVSEWIKNGTAVNSESLILNWLPTSDA